MTKAQRAENRRAVKEYWHSYLEDGHIMGWLVRCGDKVWGEYEPQGQTEKQFPEGMHKLNFFGDFYRAHGELPKYTALKQFIADIDGLKEYL